MAPASSPSTLLSLAGVRTLLVSAGRTTSKLPKAHVLHQRTMEIFHDAGVGEAVAAVSCPPAQMRSTAWYYGLAGEDPDAGRRIAKLESWGAGYTNPADRREPVRAGERAPAAPRTAAPRPRRAARTRRCALPSRAGLPEQDAHRVRARIRDHDSEQELVVEADYVLGCDGGRTVGGLIGVSLEGERDVARAITVHLTADLSRWMGEEDDDVLIRWIVHPGSPHKLSVLLPMGPAEWGARSTEWVFGMNYSAREEHLYDEQEKILAAMRERIGLPDFEPQLHAISRWQMEGLLASSFSRGRVFLLGDAAHRHPPTGGLGLNSAVADAHNLCWKLALVLSGRAGPELLATYEHERRPVVARNAQRAVENARNQRVVLAGLGLHEDASEQENRERTRKLFAATPAGAQRRAAAHAAIATQAMEFDEHNVEYGYTYASAAVLPDGSPPPQPPEDIRVYQPGTRPGSPLPHAWVERDGERVALRDLAPSTSFMLIAGEDGEAWCEAARAVASRRGIELVALRLGDRDGDYIDVRCAFLSVRGFGGDGAILVRPDRMIAWRSDRAQDDPAEVLDGALSAVLALHD